MESDSALARVDIQLQSIMLTLRHFTFVSDDFAKADRGNPKDSGWILAVPLSWSFRPVDRKLCVAIFR